MARKLCMTIILALICATIRIDGSQQPAAGAERGGGVSQRGGGGRGGGVPTTTMLKPGLFMISGIGGGASVLVRVTDDGLVLANTGTQGESEFPAADGSDQNDLR